MKVHELIENLKDADPDGEAEVFIYIHRRYGGYQCAPYEVREFIPGDGKIYICDERDPNV